MCGREKEGDKQRGRGKEIKRESSCFKEITRLQEIDS